MAVMNIDVNDMVGVNAACFRILSDNVGDDVTRAFINQFNNDGAKGARNRPKVTAAQIADALGRGKERAAAMNASVGGGTGRNFTEDRHKRPQKTFEEVTARIMQMESIMDEVKRERPELSVGKQSVMAMKRATERRNGRMAAAMA